MSELQVFHGLLLTDCKNKNIEINVGSPPQIYLHLRL